MQQVSNPFQAMVDIFVKPNRVFATISDTHNWSWLPFLLISVVSALPIYYYFNLIDFDWYRELIIQSTGSDLSPLEQNTMRSNMHQAQILWISVFGAMLSAVIANAVLALYLNITTKADEECVQGYTDWFGFAWWVSMPAIVTSLLALLVVLITQDTELSPVSLGPTSLAFIFAVPMDSDWFTLAQSIRLESVWVMYLIAVGLNQWTQLPAKKTYIIAIVPYLLIWLIWALILLF
jgi:hypothetical protein